MRQATWGNTPTPLTPSSTRTTLPRARRTGKFVSWWTRVAGGAAHTPCAGVSAHLARARQVRPATRCPRVAPCAEHHTCHPLPSACPRGSCRPNDRGGGRKPRSLGVAARGLALENCQRTLSFKPRASSSLRYQPSTRPRGGYSSSPTRSRRSSGLAGSPLNANVGLPAPLSFSVSTISHVWAPCHDDFVSYVSHATSAYA